MGHLTPHPHSQEDERSVGSAYALIQQQGEFYHAALETHRTYVLSQIESLKIVVAQGVSKEELKERLENLRKSFETDIERVHHTVSSVSNHLDRVEQNIIGQIGSVSVRQEQLAAALQKKQQDSLKRVIAIQATILMFILTSLIGIVLNLIFHFIGGK